MEYLTPQDIPQRHYTSVHAHRMSHSAEHRPMNNMAAVRQSSITSFEEESAPPSPFSFAFNQPLPIEIPYDHDWRPAYGFAVRERKRLSAKDDCGAPPLNSIRLPVLSCPKSPITKPDSRRRACRLSVGALYDDMYSERMITPLRNSPPLQPGEQAFPGKLPSFEEFVQATVERTPPHTPSRRNGSADVSPRARPFDDFSWSEPKRQRVDTLGDIYAPNRADFTDPRRMSSAVDPSLYQHRQSSTGPASMHHRPSLPYPPGPHSHVRTSSLTSNAYHQQTPPPPHYGAQPASAYEPRRASYFQETVPSQAPMPYDRYSYERASFASSASGYEHGYPHPLPQQQYDVRFQQHVGLEHTGFNRKRRGNLPKEATNVLKLWFHTNRPSPYPSEDQKIAMCNETGLTLNQVSNWFINARRRAPGREPREREVIKD